MSARKASSRSSDDLPADRDGVVGKLRLEVQVDSLLVVLDGPLDVTDPNLQVTEPVVERQVGLIVLSEAVDGLPVEVEGLLPLFALLVTASLFFESFRVHHISRDPRRGVFRVVAGTHHYGARRTHRESRRDQPGTASSCQRYRSAGPHAQGPPGELAASGDKGSSRAGQATKPLRLKAFTPVPGPCHRDRRERPPGTYREPSGTKSGFPG